MPEILQNTGAKLWSIVDDHDELQTNVFEQLCGSGGKSDIRLIDEAIGKINKNLNGYYFKIVNDKLCICKDSDSGTVNLPLSITDSNGNIALTVDGTSITIDNNGVVHGIIVDDDLNLTSENAIKNKTVKAKFDEIDEKIDSNETTLSSHATAIATLNGDGDGSVKKIANDAAVSEVAKVIANAPESLNTLKEISDWISNHEDDASAMNSAIQTNKSDIAILKTSKIDKETGKDLLADTDKANYDSAVSKSHTHDNKSVLDGITSGKVSAWDSVNDKVDKVNGKGLSTEDYTTAEKNKLSELDDTLLNKLGESTEGNLTFNGDEINVKCDTKLSTTSENPVQNKVVKTVIDNLDQAIADAKALRASLEAYGMVKLTESSAVTDSTGLALAATEKNATIEGTLANQLSQLNTDYASFVRKMSQGIRFYMDSKNMPNGFTIRDDGLVIVNDVEIYQGDIVHLAGTNNGTPYGSFSCLFCQGNYGAVRTDYFSSNSINTSDVHIGANGAWGGQLCFRITPSGTLPTNGFCDFKITVISCKRFYL